MPLWGKADSKAVKGTVTVTKYDPTANGGLGNETAAKTVTGSGTEFLTKTVDADSTEDGLTYTIIEVGDTDWTAVNGPASAQPGDVFVADSGTGSGTGRASVGLRNGETLLIGGYPYKIGNIVSNTEITLDKVFSHTLGGYSGLTVTANESPVFADGVGPVPVPYGMDAGEQFTGKDEILGVTILTGGEGYVEDPVPVATVGSGATFDVTVAAGAVTAIATTDGGSGYTRASTVTIPKPRHTVATMAVTTTATDSIEVTGHDLAAAEALQYFDGGDTALAGLTDETTYYVSAIGLDDDNFRLATTADLAAGETLTTVGTNGTAGQFTCDAATLAVGDRVQISGADTDGVFGPASPAFSDGMVLKVSEINGTSPDVIGFTLETEADAAITTADVSTTTGLTFLAGTIIDLTGTGNNAQYFERSSKTAATAELVFGAGGAEGDFAGSSVSAPGWVVVREGTGGRAGRRTYETLVVVRDIGSDAADDAVFPDA